MKIKAAVLIDTNQDMVIRRLNSTSPGTKRYCSVLSPPGFATPTCRWHAAMVRPKHRLFWATRVQLSWSESGLAFHGSNREITLCSLGLRPAAIAFTVTKAFPRNVKQTPQPPPMAPCGMEHRVSIANHAAQ